MAGDWIKVETTTPDKPEVFAISEVLKIEPDAVLGKLIRLWVWADQQTYDGAVAIPDKVVDRLVNQEGFANAMRTTGWLGDDGFPNFERHNGTTAKRRADGAKRVAKHRKDSNAYVTQSCYTPVSVPRPLVKKVMERDGYTCVYCGRKEGNFAPGRETQADAVLSIDHVMPASRGGVTLLENLVCACMCCNQAKSNRTPEECGFDWPIDVTGKRYGNVTREEKRRGKEPTNVGSSSEPKVPRPPSQYSYPMQGGKLWDLPERKLDEYLATHAEKFDVHYELRKARTWLMTNDNRRPKSARGMAGFLTRWLNRASDSNRSTMPGSRVAAKPDGNAVYNPETGEIVTPLE